MNVLKKKFSMVAVVSLILMVASCGSNPKNEPFDLAKGIQSLKDVELNADSDQGNAGGLQTVYFDFNSSRITDDARMRLEENAQLLKAVKVVDVQVAGHCDERGSVQYNLALGQRRANAVRKLLIALGVDGSRITTVSYGKERPLEFGHDESAWSKNRRAAFIITAK